MPSHPTLRTGLAVAALALVVGLVGDACHVASGTTRYEWDDFPVLWRSALWFPAMLTGSVVLGAWLARRAGLARRRHPATDAVLGAAVILALYALTAALRGEPDTVSVALVGAIAVAVWCWWDPAPGALVVATVAAVAGPAVEIAMTQLGAASYAADSDGLGGVAAWLPCLYFAAGTVTSGLWAALE